MNFPRLKICKILDLISANDGSKNFVWIKFREWKTLKKKVFHFSSFLFTKISHFWHYRLDVVIIDVLFFYLWHKREKKNEQIKNLGWLNFTDERSETFSLNLISRKLIRFKYNKISQVINFELILFYTFNVQWTYLRITFLIYLDGGE